jgi:N-acetylglucosamine kinase-like BadF-type ATPase
MIVIADSGGSKTDWRLIRGETILQYRSSGYNPNTHPLSVLEESLKKQFEAIRKNVTALYFYGAGLSTSHPALTALLKDFFPEAHVDTCSDVLGACRALAGREKGFIGILGTGSAACFYDGEQVVIQKPSMGYILGDEGSGAALGKALLRHIYREVGSRELRERFQLRFALSREDIYKKVYAGEEVNRFLASFVPFLFENRNMPEVHTLLMREFTLYVEGLLMMNKSWEGLPVHFTGSVAFHFHDFLTSLSEKYKFTLGRIVQSPIAGLALYHQSHG